MVDLSVDVIYAIAEHIEPNPITFNRLAEVSKNFRTVFTSDWVWRYLNVKALKSGIRDDFMRCVNEECLPFLKEAWGPATEKPKEIRKGPLHLWLGCGTRYEPEDELHWNDWWSRHMTWCAVHISGHAIRFALSFLADKELALLAVQKHGCVLEWLHHSLRADREVVLAAVTRGCPRDCRYHRERVSILKYAAAELCNDAELVRIAVTNNPLSLQHASIKLRKNISIIDAAVSVDGRAFKYALQRQKKSLQLAVANYGSALRWARTGHIADIAIVSTAVVNDGLALQYAAPALRANEEVVLKAVRSNGLALSYADETLRSNRSIALEAIRSNGLALEFASDAVKVDLELVEEAVQRNGLALYHAKGLTVSDFSIVKYAVENNGMAIKYASWSTPNYNDLKLIALEHVSLDEEDAKKLFEELFRSQVIADPNYALVLAHRNPGVVSLKSTACVNGEDKQVHWAAGGSVVRKAATLNPNLYAPIGDLCLGHSPLTLMRAAISGDTTIVSALTPEQREIAGIKSAISSISSSKWKKCYPDLIAKPEKAQSKIPTVGHAPSYDTPVPKTSGEEEDSETANEQKDLERSKVEVLSHQESPQYTPETNLNMPSMFSHSSYDDSDEKHFSCSSDGSIVSSYEIISDPDRTTTGILSDSDSNDEFV